MDTVGVPAAVTAIPAAFPRLPGSPVFERMLRPHRSLPRRGFHLLMLLLGLFCLGSGIAFLHIGAWPITGFFGLDVALVYFAFRLNYRNAQLGERLNLTDDAFTVERIGVNGSRRVWQFQPFWLRIVLEERDPDSNRLFVASHGQSLAIGDFLAPADRRELATTIRDALADWRRTIGPDHPD